ncbi:hypothetical protein ACIP1T_04440 [Pseudomonas japonica]|uniref:hypothetical protein n=1 Tax=Pseudomonas japonica TaxID=256466 RepID=UPI0038140A73
MDVRRLTSLDSLEALLNTDERERPGLILVGATTVPQTFALLPHIEDLADLLPQFVFYALDLDDYRTPRRAQALNRLLEALHIDAPAQVLLPSNCPPVTLHATRDEEIDKALKRLY